MSVSRGGSGAQDYGDFIIQRILTEYVVDADEQVTDPGHDQAAVRDVAGGNLSRGEEAELVKFVMWNHQAFSNPAGTDRTEILPHLEIGLNPLHKIIAPFSAEQVQATSETNIDGSVIDRTGAETDDPDVLYHGEALAHTGHDNDTESNQGPGDNRPGLQGILEVDFRDFGGGPVLTDRDQVYEHIYMNERDNYVELWGQRASYLLMWDVRER